MHWWKRIFRKGDNALQGSMAAHQTSATTTPDVGALAQYHTDVPIHTSDEDEFDRAPFARRIAQTIVGRRDPSSLVLGIYGPWGEGKTSVLNLIRTTLGDIQDIVTVNFNPWRMDGEPALLRNFFGALAAALEKSLSNRKERVGSILEQYGALLGAIPAVGSGMQSAAATLGKRWGEPVLEDLRARVGDLLKEGGKKIVVFIDDIDRLDKGEIQALFRLIKLSADFDNTIYVLAFDERMVAGALGERFASDSNEHFKAGQNFLEKIVQVPLNLPATTAESRRQYCYKCVLDAVNSTGIDLTQDDLNHFLYGFQQGVEIQMKTPRMVKRYANALTFAFGALKGECHPVDVMLVEALRVFYQPLFEFIRKNRDIVIGTDRESNQRKPEALKTIVHDQMKELTEEEINAAIELLAILFPRTGKMGYGYEWEQTWIGQQRVCSYAYFSRYFSYGVGDDDVSDLELETALALLNESGGKDSSPLTPILRTSNAKRVVDKFSAREEQLSPEEAAAYAKALIRCGAPLSKAGGMFGEKSPWTQAAMLISRLIALQPKQQRADLAAMLFTEASPISFGLELHRWLTCAEKDEDQVVPVEDQPLMKSAIVTRIRDHIKALNAPLFIAEREDFMLYLTAWTQCDGNGPIKSYLESELKTHPKCVLEFVRCFLGNAHVVETGIPFQPPMMRHSYDYLQSVVDPELLASIISTVFGVGPEVSAADFKFNRDPDRALAQQYIRMNNFVRKQSSVSPKNDDPGSPPPQQPPQ